MESQIILLLITIASLGKSEKCCVSYLSNKGHKKLILMFFQGIFSNITIYFIEIFREVVERRIENPRGRLTR